MKPITKTTLIRLQNGKALSGNGGELPPEKTRSKEETTRLCIVSILVHSYVNHSLFMHF
jgi:hypothetical protein